jgi:hypothetical protein
MFIEQAQSAIQPPPPWSEDEVSTVTRAYFIIEECAADNGTLESALMRKYTPIQIPPELRIEAFFAQFLQPIVDYLDEKLDDNRAIFALLLRYKKKCEWFARELLVSLSMRAGERGLAKHLYEYLHDQGFVFHIEPKSASGQVDLLADQASGDPFVADAKIFNPKTKHERRKIIEGFAQVYRYAVDYNEPFGYLIIFKTGSADLRFLTEMSQGTPLVVCNGKTIFFLVIDVDSHKKPASKGGRLNPTEISQAELIQCLPKMGNSTANHAKPA